MVIATLMNNRRVIWKAAKALTLLLVLALLYFVLRRIGFRNVLQEMGKVSSSSVRAALLPAGSS